jgi:hypothetical protein
MDQLELVIISAILNGLFASIGIYIGLKKGTEKTVDTILDRLHIVAFQVEKVKAEKNDYKFR